MAIRPATISIEKPSTPSWRKDRLAGAARVARSRPAKPSIPMTASSDSGPKPSVPGRKTISTPRKPAITASQRRGPMVSPKTKTAPTMTTSGVA